jgi:hypothetical protein
MERRNRLALAALLLVGGALSFGPSPTPPAVAQGEPPGNRVRVINTSAEPVPTSAVGTTPVSGILGLDQAANGVRIVNGQAQPVPVAPVGVTRVGGDVRVENSPADPVAVRDAAVWNAVHVSESLRTAEALSQHPVFNVPAGKRLVIEFVSVVLEVPHDEWAGVAIENRLNGAAARNWLELGRLRRVSSDRFTASEQVRLYADPGTVVQVFLARDPLGAGGEMVGSINLSGYLVDL